LASKTVDSARDAANSASNAVDSAREAPELASKAVDRAREAADSAREVTCSPTSHPTNQDRKPLVLMTWNASRLLSSGRELALMNLLISSAVDIATVTECEMSETSKY
jgi:hypothetical protein